LPGKVEGLRWCESGSILGVSCGDSDVVLFKEAYDGRYEEVGKVNEPGYVEVPNSITAAVKTNVPSIAPQNVAPQPQVNQELQQQTQNVLESFGGFC